MRKTLQIILLTAALLMWGCAAYARGTNKCESHGEKEATLCSYEPTTVGWTFDSDADSFLDFKLSVRYQLIPRTTTRFLNWLQRYSTNYRKDLVLHDLRWGWGDNSALYFAFTGRFGQYFDRSSSPVVSKRFNPKFFMRFWTNDEHENYIDVSYAHESDGQSIHTAAQLQEAIAKAKDPAFAYDHISRGWDYLGLEWKHILSSTSHRTLSTHLECRYFLSDGLLQGKSEEYDSSWENNPEGKPRNKVNGLSALIELHQKGEGGFIDSYLHQGQLVFINSYVEFFKDLKCALGIETGYRQPFRYDTYRGEVGTKIMELPMTLWVRYGYGSDLAQYYKKVTSWGVRVEIGNF